MPRWRLESNWGERRGVAGCLSREPGRSSAAAVEWPGRGAGCAVWKWAGGRAAAAEVSARLSTPGLRGGGRHELRGGRAGRRRRLAEEHESAAAAAAVAVEGARWPSRGPGDSSLLTAVAAARGGRGSGTPRPSAAPRPSRGPPAPPPPPSSRRSRAGPGMVRRRRRWR